MPIPLKNADITEKAKKYINSARKKITYTKENFSEKRSGRATAHKTGEIKKEYGAVHEALKCVVFALSGIILGCAPLPHSVYPLGTALTLSVTGDKYAFFSFIGSAAACIGYGDEAAAFFAVNTLCFFTRAFFSSFKFDESVKKRLLSASLIAFLCAAIIICVGGFDKNYTIYGISYAADLIAACICFCSVVPTERKKRELIFSGGVLATSFMFVYALSKIPINGFSPAVMLSAFIILYCSTRLGAIHGLLSGLVCGIAASSFNDVSYAISFGIAGFLSASFNTKKLAVSAVAFKISFCALLLYINGTVDAVAIFSAVLASVLFIPLSEVLPPLRAKSIVPFTVCNKKNSGFERLSGAFTSLSEVVYNVSDKLKYPNASEVKEKITGTVISHCASCEMCDSCSTKALLCSQGAFDILCERLMSGGVTASDIPDKYAGSCTKLLHLAEKLNEGYAELVNDRFKENKTEILASEYSTMARLIKYTSQKTKTDKTEDKELTEKANAALAAIGVRFTSLEAYGQRLKTIDIRGVKLEKLPCNSEELAHYMSEKCGYLFGEPEYIGIGENSVMRFTRKRKIKLEYARCACAKENNNVNGDSVNFFESDEHFFYALISDGMGSGRSAALTSRLTSVFIEKLLTTGAHKTVTLEMLNNLLLSKNDESFATVDLLEIDLLSGEASFIKAGAAPAYILRASKLYKIASFTPPAGIIRSFNAENTKFFLEKGDTVMMLSDGIVQSYDEVPWLCELLSASSYDDPARLSERVLQKAKKINLREDDMTCVAIKVL